MLDVGTTEMASIEPELLRVELKRQGRFLLAQPVQPVEQLTAALLERTRDQLRSEREADALRRIRREAAHQEEQQ